MNILKLEFERDSFGKVIFSESNLKKLNKYVLPIIQRNRGWSTEELAIEDFKVNPEKWRTDIDGTVEADHKGQVYIALENRRPIGLLEYIETDFNNVPKDFQDILREMTVNPKSSHWKEVFKYVHVDYNLFQSFFPQLKEFILSKKFYTHVGVVLLPELQGKKTGISDELYKIMKQGFIYGWTSTPLVIAKRRKLFKDTVFFPPQKEEIKSLGTLACLTVVSARIFSKRSDSIEKYGFGIDTYKEFARRDKEEYMQLSKSFLKKGKLTQNDYERLDKILDFERGQGAIISVS